MEVKSTAAALHSLLKIRPVPPYPLGIMPDREPLIPPHGGYEQLHSFQKARIVNDGTVRFCDRFIDPRSRTHDQMVQAARSGKQNILETKAFRIPSPSASLPSFSMHALHNIGVWLLR